jgi:hypothetical protein
MVPMQCTLNVLFEAKYVGFAQKDTFFTQVLEDYENLDPNSFSFDTDIAPQELAAYKEAITNDLEQVTMLVAFSDDDDSGRAWSYYPASGGTYSIDDDDSHWFTSLVSNQDGAGPSSKLEEGVEKNTYYFKVGFPKARIGSKLVQLANSGKEVSLDVTARYSLWRWSDEVNQDLSAYRGAFSIATNSANGNPAQVRKNTATGSGTSQQRLAGREFFGKLWDWKANLQNANTFETEDNGGNERAFRHVIRISSGELNQSRLVTDAKDADNQDITISLPSTGANQLQDAFNAGYTTKAVVEKNDGNYDRSVDLTNLNANWEKDKFPEYRTDQGSKFWFGIEYEVEVSVTIDGNEIPATRVVDHVLLPFVGYGNDDDGGSGTYISTKTVNLDWGASFGEIDEEIQEAALDDATQLANDLIDAGAAGI